MQRPASLFLRVTLPVCVALAATVPTVQADDFSVVGSATNYDITPAPSVPPQNLGSFDIIINADPGLSANPAALAAFNRAALQWESYIADSITVNITANLGALGAGIIGSASSVILQAPYNTIRNQMVADASDEVDDAVVAFLPTFAQFSGTLKAGSTFTGNVIGTKANLKALGFTGLDAGFGASDATLTFSNTFSFDFDNSDGVGAGLLDFETVAAHEIGHALGFFSSVDSADAGDTTMDIATLDLFRFAGTGGNDPSSNATFTSAPRNFVPGAAGKFDDLANEWLFSTGLTGGDGRQASHWKADELTSNFIGIMDPTLSNGVAYDVAFSDLRAFDVIGYEIIPEPSTWLLFALGGLVAGNALFRRRRMA